MVWSLTALILQQTIALELDKLPSNKIAGGNSSVQDLIICVSIRIKLQNIMDLLLFLWK